MRLTESEKTTVLLLLEDWLQEFENEMDFSGEAEEHDIRLYKLRKSAKDKLAKDLGR